MVRCEVIICEGTPEPTRDEILKKFQDVDGIFWEPLEAMILDASILDAAGN